MRTIDDLVLRLALVALIFLAPGRVKGKARGSHRSRRAHKSPIGVTFAVADGSAVITSVVSQKFTAAATIPVRDIAARLPTITLLEELERRAGLESTGPLADAMMTNGHPLGQWLAEFPERLAALRRETAARRSSLRSLD
jgi:hypothetical protein